MPSIYQRWGIQLSDERRLLILKRRLKVLAGDDVQKVTKTEARLVAFGLGAELEDIARRGGFDSDWRLYVGNIIDGANSTFELARRMETLIDKVQSLRAGASTIANIINSSGCGIHFSEADDGWESYPAGEDLLDKELVDKPLSFLSGNTLREYRKALGHYTEGKWEECAEKTRRALEEFLRVKLANTKGLDANIKALGQQLKSSSDVPVHLRNTVVGILLILDTHYNESSKHNSKTDKVQEAEFLIYQVGLLMRLLDRIVANP